MIVYEQMPKLLGHRLTHHIKWVVTESGTMLIQRAVSDLAGVPDVWVKVPIERVSEDKLEVRRT